MAEFDVTRSADDVLAECVRRGLEVRSVRELAGKPASRHWHLAFPGRSGTLELSDDGARVWLKVHPRRDGGWATDFARSMAADYLAR